MGECDDPQGIVEKLAAGGGGDGADANADAIVESAPRSHPSRARAKAEDDEKPILREPMGPPPDGTRGFKHRTAARSETQ